MSKVLTDICKDFESRLRCYEKDHPDTNWVLTVADGSHNITMANSNASDFVALMSAAIYGLAEDMEGDTALNCVDLTDQIRTTTVCAAKFKETAKNSDGKTALKAVLKELVDELND